MGIYLVDKQLLNIFYKETTIIRRLNVHGISIRTMVVVSVYTQRATTTKSTTHFASHFYYRSSNAIIAQILARTHACTSYPH